MRNLCLSAKDLRLLFVYNLVNCNDTKFVGMAHSFAFVT